MEQSVLLKEAGRNRQLTERDRELCGFLALCRYLTREQVERLMFPGRSKARSSTRLRQLAARVGGQSAVLRGDSRVRKCRRMDDGLGSDARRFRDWSTAGRTTGGSRAEARRRAGVPQARGNGQRGVPGTRAAGREDAGEGARHFRWTLGEYLNLPFEEFDQTALRVGKRRLQPDAMIEDPSHHRRYFIEYETGSATIFDAKKATSTRAKVGRYVAFFRGNYRTHFRDGWKPRLLFVTQSEARRQSIERLLEKEGFPTTGEYAARALTLDGAKHFLSRKLSASASSPARELPMPPRRPSRETRPPPQSRACELPGCRPAPSSSTTTTRLRGRPCTLRRRRTAAPRLGLGSRRASHPSRN